MSNAIDFSKLSIDDIQKLQKQAEKALSSKKKNDLKSLRQQVDAILKGTGVSLQDLLAVKTTAKKTASKPVAVKYRNPKNPTETWTGRGKQPVWLSKAIAAGVRLEQFAI